jgi:hypothetical protein
MSTDSGGPVLTSFYEISFGDGIRHDIQLSDFSLMLTNKAQRYYRIAFDHVFPGPGNYIISFRATNRDAEIKNMVNSVNTPLYIESSVTLDPIFGCNTPPRLENLPYHTSKSGSSYQFDFSVIEPDDDSISFKLAHAFQDEGVQVVNYEIATEYDESGLRKIGRVLVDPFTGKQIWSQANIDGEYNIVLKMTEWRKIDAEYHQLSETDVDYAVRFAETENLPPQISGLQDTVLIAGSNFSTSITVEDPENDSIQMLLYGDLFQLLKNPPKNDLSYFAGPLNYHMNFMSKPEHVRSRPYKILISAIDRSSGISLNETKSVNVWITDRAHQPDQPNSFLAQALKRNLIGLYWNDTEDELGYILERADVHFPSFEKIAVLPANSTFFNDSTVVENNTYTYRIKAVGTKMSDYLYAEATTPDIVTAAEEWTAGRESIVFPNPNSGKFRLDHTKEFSYLQIIDLTGKVVYDEKL